MPFLLDEVLLLVLYHMLQLYLLLLQLYNLYSQLLGLLILLFEDVMEHLLLLIDITSESIYFLLEFPYLFIDHMDFPRVTLAHLRVLLDLLDLMFDLRKITFLLLQLVMSTGFLDLY
jgi:hypothetical protein